MEELKWSLMCESFSGVMESGVRGDKNVYRAHKNAFKIPAECVSSKVWKENQLGCVPLWKSFPGIWHRRRKKKFCENDAFACWMMAFVIPTALRNQHLTTKVKDQRDSRKFPRWEAINTQFGACTLPHRHNESPSCACRSTAWGCLNDGNKCMTTKSVSCQKHQQEARDFPLFSLSHSSGTGGNTEK